MKKLLAGIIGSFLMTTSVFALSPLPPLFSDVDASTDYYQAIQWMKDNQVIGGYSDGTFRPDSCVNRVEFLKMLFASQDTNVSGYSTAYFNDTNINAWYAAYLNAAVARGVVEGYQDGTFRPENCVNRVEAMKMAIEEFNLERYQAFYGGYPKDIDSKQWYFDYFDHAFASNLVGTAHMNNENGWGYYGPADSMTRKEVAEMLFRMKAVKDNYANQYSSGIYPRDLNEVSSYCTDEPEMTDIGRSVYPISPNYENTPFLGQLFTAFECGPERVSEIFGVSGDYYTMGARITIDANANHTPYLIEAMEDIGFICNQDGSGTCTDWLLNKNVKVGELVKMRHYTTPIIREDCYMCG